MSIDEINARMAEIKAADTTAMTAEEIRALSAEIDQLKAERQKLEDAEALRVELRNKVAGSETAEVVAAVENKEEITEERKMADIEIRNTPAYINAFANAIKSGDDTECRALLSENATSGTIPVPEVVYDTVRTSWQRNTVIARVRRIALKGNLKVSFEISGSDAQIHTEGGDPITEEELSLGIVTIVPTSIKKYVGISDEALDMTGETFLRYIYDELTYKIAQKAQAVLISKIIACGTVSTATAVGVPKVTSTTITLGLVASAIGELSEDARDNVIVMNKATWAQAKAVAYAASYPVDIFEGLPVEFDNSLPSFSAATTGETYMIVGDFANGALITEPDGDNVKIKYDDMTLATNDIVRIIGRQMIGIGVVGPNSFVKVVK